MKRLFVASAILAIAATGCAGGDPNVTGSGKSKPIVSVEFPTNIDPGSEHDAVLTIENPGPGDMQTVVVAFASIGPTPGAQEMPISLVGVGSKRENPSIVGVDPEPAGISPDAVVFTFGPQDGAPRLPEGETITITFTLKAPVVAGPAANSVQVYDGADVDRAAGVRLHTDVGR